MRGQDLYWRLVSRRDDYRAVFGTQEGRRVLADILDCCGVLKDTHAPGDPATSHRNAGCQAIGQIILRRLHMDEEQLMRLAKETADHG